MDILMHVVPAYLAEELQWYFCTHTLCIIQHVYQILQNKATKEYRKDVVN